MCCAPVKADVYALVLVRVIALVLSGAMRRLAQRRIAREACLGRGSATRGAGQGWRSDHVQRVQVLHNGDLCAGRQLQVSQWLWIAAISSVWNAIGMCVLQ